MNAISVLKDLWYWCKRILKSKYKWLAICYFVWLYRVNLIVADAGGFAKGLQVVTLLGMMYFAGKFFVGRNVWSFSFKKTNNAVKTCLLLYSFAVISTVWAYLPQFAFFLAFQNLVFIVLFVGLFSMFKSLKAMERFFLLFALSSLLFEGISWRMVKTPALFVHYLSCGSSAAMVISYTAGEILANKKSDRQRQRFLKSVLLIAAVIIVLSTSSGANASAIFGIAVGSFFSGKIIWAALLAAVAGLLFLFRDLADSLLFFIMPGKTREDIDSATGREILWEYIRDLCDEKPILGWGYGCVERIAADISKISAPDAHNNYLGLRGSLGYIGLCIAIMHLAVTWFTAWRDRIKPGYVGILSAISCALLNGYSYGFLSGKACSITVLFFGFVVLTWAYSRVPYDNE